MRRPSRRPESARAQTRDSLVLFERNEAETRTLRTTLAERESKIIMLEREQASTRLAQESHAKTLAQTQTELSAARTRADGLLTDLNDSRGAAASLDAQLKRAKFDLEASRNELASVKAQAHSYLDVLRTREWRRASQDSDAGHAALEGGAHRLQLQAQLEAMQAQLEARDIEIRAAAHERATISGPRLKSSLRIWKSTCRPRRSSSHCLRCRPSRSF